MMRKRKSEVWQYFTLDSSKTSAQCLKCGKTYKTSGNTTNLLDHLKRSHQDIELNRKPAVYEIIPVDKDEVEIDERIGIDDIDDDDDDEDHEIEREIIYIEREENFMHDYATSSKTETDVKKRKIIIQQKEEQLQNKKPKVKTNMTNESTVSTSTPVQKFEYSSNQSKPNLLLQRRDSYDHFGQYMASLLREIGPPTSIMLQQEFTTLVYKKMQKIHKPSPTTREALISVRYSGDDELSNDPVYSSNENVQQS